MNRARVAFDPEWAEYGDGHKLLSDNREIYQAMSRMTVNGRVPDAEAVRQSFKDQGQVDERN